MTPDSQAGQAYRNIARRLRGEEVPFMNIMEEKEVNNGFFDRVRKLFSGK
jgi:septum site-determining protein MinD